MLFPPYRQPSDVERTEEPIADWAKEGKPSLTQRRPTLNMVTEVWAEPQFGELSVLNSELKYLEGLYYNQVPHAVCWLFLPF